MSERDQRTEQKQEDRVEDLEVGDEEARDVAGGAHGEREALKKGVAKKSRAASINRRKHSA